MHGASVPTMLSWNSSMVCPGQVTVRHHSAERQNAPSGSQTMRHATAMALGFRLDQT